MTDVVGFAYQVLDMQATICEQARELERLKGIEKKYNDLLDSSLRHAGVMQGNVLRLMLTPGVVEALKNSAERPVVRELPAAGSGS